MDMDLTLINYSFLENAGLPLLLVADGKAVTIHIAVSRSIVRITIAIGISIHIQSAWIAIRIRAIQVAGALIRISL